MASCFSWCTCGLWRQDGRKRSVPKWGKQVLACGGDKYIYQGTLDDQSVAVCVSKGPAGSRRLANEVSIFKKIGNHPYIINMCYSGKTKEGLSYLAMEIVQPIGYDLDRMMNQYQFAGQSVPVPLFGRIIGQLVEALKHMHKLRLIHRDLKTENVLVDANYQAKLIDMGIVAKFGASDALRAAYMAPELCNGVAQGAEVDCYGVGVIFHQVYQHRWQILNIREKPVKMMNGTPSTKYAMEPEVRKAMDGLLTLNRKDRWTMDALAECEWVKTREDVKMPLSQEFSNAFASGTGSLKDDRKFLQLFKCKQPMPTALAVFINTKNHSHLINKPLGELELGKKLGVTVLLIRRANASFERVPSVQTQIQRGDWMYFGVPQGQEFNKAVDDLDLLLHTNLENAPEVGRNSSGRFRSLSKKDVAEGKLVEFTVEFDCFFFPEHIGRQVEVGVDGLHLRSRFGINLVGIERHGQQDEDLEWFPKGNTIVQPGDVGLVMREPCADGTTRPTLMDEDVAPLMNADLFRSQTQTQGTGEAAVFI